jgi:hypothetical protein
VISDLTSFPTRPVVSTRFAILATSEPLISTWCITPANVSTAS